MHRPAVNDILNENQSYYSLVIAVAKRAREIAIDAELNEKSLSEKPVKTAVEEFARGDYNLTEVEGIGVDKEY